MTVIYVMKSIMRVMKVKSPAMKSNEGGNESNEDYVGVMKVM